MKQNSYLISVLTVALLCLTVQAQFTSSAKPDDLVNQAFQNGRAFDSRGTNAPTIARFVAGAAGAQRIGLASAIIQCRIPRQETGGDGGEVAVTFVTEAQSHQQD